MLSAFATVHADEREALLGLGSSQLDHQELRRLAAMPSPYPRALEIIDLTRRERQLATALAGTASRQQIAAQLFVAHNTVRTQLGTLYRKLGVTTREQALRRLHELGIV